MKAACCDWALLAGFPAGDRAPNARTCPRHLRERTRHLRPLVPLKRARAARNAARAETAATWARWTAAVPAGDQ